MTDKDGGPAYPINANDPSLTIECGVAGITVRQYYKAAAMIAFLPLCKDATTPVTEESLAKQCGAFADAMLKEDEEHGK